MNFNNKLQIPNFNSRSSTRNLLPISNLKLDYELQIGGFNYQPNTPFKTVLNRISHELSMASSSGANSALSNLASVAINTALIPGTSDGAALGSTTKQWSDLFLAEGAVINWDNGDATLTQAGNVVTLAGANFVVDTITVNTSLLPDANDGAVLGSTSLSFSDLFLASGAVINFNNGNATLTHSTGALTSNVQISVPDAPYDVSAWNGSNEVPTKNAVSDQFESLGGTYTPTTTGISNVDSVSASPCQWLRSGNVVTVSGYLAIDPTSNSTLTTVAVSLPIASNFGNDYECGGTGSDTAGASGAFYGDAATNRAYFGVTSTGTAVTRYYFSFTYQII